MPQRSWQPPRSPNWVTSIYLVNNAGGSRPLPVDAPDSDWDEAISLNFTRYRQVTHALLPQMIERRWGRIINITGKSEPEGLNAAFAAKAAVHAWAKGLSREIGQHGITVNCIPPGRIMSEQIRRNYPEDYRKHFAEEEIPVGYWGEPEDLAVLAVFLASPWRATSPVRSFPSTADFADISSRKATCVTDRMFLQLNIQIEMRTPPAARLTPRLKSPAQSRHPAE